MDGYKHYIRLKENDVIIIKRFSSAFEEPQEGDICVNEDGGRHFNDPITNERGQYDRQWISGQEILRSREVLDAEWLERPPEPPSEIELIGRQLVDRELESLLLRSENELLGSQLVSIDLRLLEGGL